MRDTRLVGPENLGKASLELLLIHDYPPVLPCTAMDRQYTVKGILGGVSAAVILTGVLMGLYGWMLGLAAGIFFVVAWALIEFRIVR